MRWLHNISFSFPASSSSTASPVSDHHHNHLLHSRSHSSNLNGNTTNNSNNNKNNNNNGNNELRGPRLTRQKKLRHLTDHEIGEVTKFTPNKAETITLTRSKSNYDHFTSSSSTAAAVPLPLPLPLPVPEENGDPRLVSPRDTAAEAHVRAVEERDRDGVRDRDRIGRAGEVVSSSNSPVASKFPGHAAKKNHEHKAKRHSKSPRQGLNAAESYQDNFRLNVPTKSAPTSPFGSPVLSPKRTSASGMFQYYCNVPEGNQGWSAPEMPTLDIPGLPPPAFFDYTALSADSSPFHSPRSRSPCKNPRSPTGSSSPIHPKMSRENNGHLEVHPLPLPPGAIMSSPLPSTPQVPAMNSQWQKGKPIGRGTFGSVYVATNRETGALCAMKEVEIFPDDPKSAECIKQLEQEIKVLSQLRHPNIVQYYGSEIVEDKFYIYLEYVHPGSINKYVREHCGAITESVVRNFTRHIVSGLAYLHSKKTIHRDIKGANLLVDASGVVKLADFGMAKLLTGQAADLSLKGSPYWMAPELMMAVMQKDSSSDLALAVDIWSLGCTIIEMFTGKPPWSEYEGAAAMFKVMRDTPPIPESLSAEARDFLRCCFQRNPAERPSASMLLEHRFLKSSPHIDVPSCSHSFSAMKLTEKYVSPPNRSETKVDQLRTLPNSPSTRSMTTSESENAVQQRSHHETSDLTVASSHYSPRSILEAPPLLSPSYEAPFVLSPSREAQHAVSPPREVHYTMSPPRESHYVMSPPREAHYEMSPPREAHYVISPPRSMSPPLEAHYAMSPPREALFLFSPPREASPPNLSPPCETHRILSPSHPGQSRNQPSPSAISRGGPTRSQI